MVCPCTFGKIRHCVELRMLSGNQSKILEPLAGSTDFVGTLNLLAIFHA